MSTGLKIDKKASKTKDHSMRDFLTNRSTKTFALRIIQSWTTVTTFVTSFFTIQNASLWRSLWLFTVTFECTDITKNNPIIHC